MTLLLKNTIKIIWNRMESETSKKSIKMPKIIILEHIESETHQKNHPKIKIFNICYKTRHKSSVNSSNLTSSSYPHCI